MKGIDAAARGTILFKLSQSIIFPAAAPAVVNLLGYTDWFAFVISASCFTATLISLPSLSYAAKITAYLPLGAFTTALPFSYLIL